MKSRVDMIKIGIAIHRQRLYMRKTIVEIAKDARMSNRTIVYIEKGHHNIRGLRITTLDRIAQSLGWTLVELLQASYLVRL